MKNYVVKQPGEIIGDLEVQTITRYENNEPVYATACRVCGVSGNPVTHDQFRKGTARCVSSFHGKPAIEPASSASAQVTGRDGGWNEYYSAKLSEPVPPEPPTVDLEQEQREKRRAAEQQRRSDLIHQRYRTYFNHATTHGWNLEKLWSLADFSRLSEATMEEFLAKQQSGYYDPKPRRT